MCLYNYTEMARVTGIPFNYVLVRGQQVKVISQLYRKASDQDLVIPAIRSESKCHIAQSFFQIILSAK